MTDAERGIEVDVALRVIGTQRAENRRLLRDVPGLKHAVAEATARGQTCRHGGKRTAGGLGRKMLERLNLIAWLLLVEYVDGRGAKQR